MTGIDTDALMLRITSAYADAAELVALFTIPTDVEVDDPAINAVSSRLGCHVNPGPIFQWLAAWVADLILELAEHTGVTPETFVDKVWADAVDAIEHAERHLRNVHGGA